MAENNEKAGGGGGGEDEAGGGGGGKDEAGGDGGWNGPEFSIHLKGKKFSDVKVEIVRKKKLLITERGSKEFITSSKLPRRVSTEFTPFMKDGFLVLSFERLRFGRKVWKVLLGGAVLGGVLFGCVSDVDGLANRQRDENDEGNMDNGQ